MTSKRLWMIGCIVFAAISAYLTLDRSLTGFAQYSSGVRDRIVTSQRDDMFKIIQQAQPPIKADQVQRAAVISKMSIQRDAGSLRVRGIEFVLSGEDVKEVRSLGYQ